MELSGRGSLCSYVKEGSSSSAKNKKNRPGRIKLRVDQMNPVCNSGKKGNPALVGSQEEEYFDLGKLLDKESCNGENESLWLSSDCNSPSSFFSKYRSSGLPHISLEQWLTCLRLGNGIGFFDGSRISPIEEACLALGRSIQDKEKNLREDLKEEEVITWLLSSTENDLTDSSSAIFSESSGSSYEHTLEESAGSESPSTPLISHINSRFRGLDLDRTDFWVSLVSLDGEDSKWISDAGSDLDSLQSSDFPSPSYKNSILSSKVQSWSSGASTAEDLEDLNTDEPLFWPFEQKPDWTSGNWDCFAISPRKNIRLLEHAKHASPKSIPLHTRNTDAGELRRRLVFPSGSTASGILEWKQRGNKKGFTRTNSTPSRLSKPAKNSMTVAPLEQPNRKVIDQIFLEEDFISNGELPIETLLGLDEFNGHEGVDLEFSEEEFILDKSL